jgi:hypothetical protein
MCWIHQIFKSYMVTNNQSVYRFYLGGQLKSPELGFVAPPAPPPPGKAALHLLTCLHATIWSRSTFEVFGRAPAGTAEEAGAGALPNRVIIYFSATKWPL